MKTCRDVITLLVFMALSGICWLPISQPAYGGESKLVISHAPGMCVTAGTPIAIGATIQSASVVEEARLYFKTSAMPSYYFVTMTGSAETMYRGVLPALKTPGTVLEYRITAVDAAANIGRSPVFYTLSRATADCAEQSPAIPDAPIIVYAEDALPPSEDFSGEQVEWQTATASEVAYLANRKHLSELQGEGSLPHGSPLSDPGTPRLSKQMLFGIGAGVGAAAIAGVLALQEPEEKIQWTIDVASQAKKVKVEMMKVPRLQTACGTWVNNQLYVTNSNPAAITIGIIRYEIVLTKDSPSGSCEPGRVGSFGTNWATVVQPGARVLIREWANEVNPCSGCPYLNAECRWNSRYIVQTSVGEASVETDFIVKGNLCGGTSLKSAVCREIRGDVEP